MPSLTATKSIFHDNEANETAYYAALTATKSIFHVNEANETAYYATLTTTKSIFHDNEANETAYYAVSTGGHNCLFADIHKSIHAGFVVGVGELAQHFHPAVAVDIQH